MQNVKVEPTKKIDEYPQSPANFCKVLSNDKPRKAPQRPILLSVLTVIATLAQIGNSGFILKQMEENSANILPFILNFLAIAVLIGLYYGRYWAWVGIQVLWSVTLAINIAETLSSNFPPSFLIINTIIMVLLWIYIYFKKVRAFCSM